MWALLIGLVVAFVGLRTLIGEARAETLQCSAPQVVDGGSRDDGLCVA
jgi:hypothetical protein